jgi:hypothetical protein
LNKVNFFDKRILQEFLQYLSAISAILSIILIFVDIPATMKLCIGGSVALVLIIIYFVLWIRANKLRLIDLDVEGSHVIVKSGDIFEQNGFKVIAFNEYFDTQVDDRIISSQSLNGIFINKLFSESTVALDEYIKSYQFDDDVKIEEQPTRRFGKNVKYSIGTICLYDDYILAAFTKFDENNRALLTMPEYLEFLIRFWDNVNRVYSQKSVSVPIFGSGITRIKEHKNISDEDLLKIMLWTFRISEMRFKYPAKLTIVIHKDKINKINLLDIKTAKNGL